MFITLEGTDGSGKSTQLGLLHRRLLEQGRDVLLTREPGGPPVAEAIRGVVLSNEFAEMEPMTEALLCAAARAQHVRQTIRPALAQGRIVLCDRFYDSSVAYQGFGRGLGIEIVEHINAPAVDGLEPDRTYLLMLDDQAARARRSADGDRIEGQGENFFERVRQGYEWVARSPRVMTVNASLPAQRIFELIWADLSPRLHTTNA